MLQKKNQLPAPAGNEELQELVNKLVTLRNLDRRVFPRTEAIGKNTGNELLRQLVPTQAYAPNFEQNRSGRAE